MGLLGSRLFYKPFEYPWAFDAFKKQNQAHWLPEEVPMDQDLKDYRFGLSDSERKVVTQILKFFTQADIDVANNYMDRLLNHFQLPELRMMLSSFTAMEAVHVHAYAYLSDSLNLDSDDNFYSSFLDIEEMKDKHDYLSNIKIDSRRDLAKVVAIFGGFVEGVQLFSSFAILNSFPRRNLLKGTGQIVTWSIKDESLHCTSMCKLFRTLIEEDGRIWTDKFKRELYEACRHIVELEDRFIDVCFEMGDIPGLKSEDVKSYVRYMADIRLGDLGLKPFYKISKHPLPWLDTMINTVEFSNFFEQRATNYTKGAIIDDMGTEVK